MYIRVVFIFFWLYFQGSTDVAEPATFTASEEVRKGKSGILLIIVCQVDPDDLAKRTAFLKQQRDKLLQMKKIEREKQLAIAEASQGKMRPKSARAARSAFGSGGRQHIDPKTLEIRRSLAEKLKKEVIGEVDE